MAKKTPKEIENVIKETWIAAKERGKELTGGQVEYLARNECLEKGHDPTQFPQKRKIHYIVEEAKKQYGLLPDDIKSEGEAWSMASLERYPIPADALPSVLRLWRFCLLQGYVLSIREVKWAAWLQSVITNTAMLQVWSRIYTDRELLCKMKQITVITHDLDASLTMGTWELTTAYWMKKIYVMEGNRNISWLMNCLLAKYGPEKYSDPKAFEEVQAIERRVLQMTIRKHTDPSRCPKDISEQRILLQKYRENMFDLSNSFILQNDLSNLSMSSQVARVYALWLVFLIEGPDWMGFSFEEQLEIIVQLRERIQKMETELHQNDNSEVGYMTKWLLKEEERKMEGIKPGRDFDYNLPFVPTHLLEKVGYPVNHSAHPKKGGGK